MFGLKDKVAGIIGGGMAFGLSGLCVALTITRGTLATRTAELATVKAARAADQSEWRRATAEAQAKDAEHARQVEQQQAQIAQETQDALETQLADARAIAARWMREHAQADSGGGGGAAMPGTPDPARDANLASARALVSGADLDACAVSYTVARGWQEWWTKVQPVWAEGATRRGPDRKRT